MLLGIAALLLLEVRVAPANELASAYANNGATCCPSDCDDMYCCNHFWSHRTGVFGDLIVLHPTGVDFAHAIQQNGAGGPGTVPLGRVGVVDPNYKTGFRAGFTYALDQCSSVTATYSFYQNHATDALLSNGGLGDTVRSLVLHPGTTTAGSTSTLLSAEYDIDYKTVDVDYSRLWSGCEDYAINYDLGVRYAQLNQHFAQLGNFAPSVGSVQTTSNVNFDGVGLRAGVDGRRRIGDGGWATYGKSFLNVLFGEFRSEYVQFNRSTQTTQALSYWNDERVVPVLEYELGLSWTSCCGDGNWRISAGYYTAFWFNIISDAEHVQAVQNANFVGLHETVAFDGFVTRVEYLW